MKQKIVDAYMQTARVFAGCSTATRLKVGAIIVDPNTGAIISVGYNGTLPGSSNQCEENGKTKDEVLHAEENAIAKLAKGGFPALGTWMFVTHSPCIKCARLIVASGIDRVFYDAQFDGRLGCGLELLSKHEVTTFRVTT
jgi:dCMP deaminase